MVGEIDVIRLTIVLEKLYIIAAIRRSNTGNHVFCSITAIVNLTYLPTCWPLAK